MILRVKLFYMSIGFQIAGALLFAFLGELGYALMSACFAIAGWYLAEHSLDHIGE